MINVSHSEDNNEGVVTVWYYAAEGSDAPESDDAEHLEAVAASALDLRSDPNTQAARLDDEIDRLTRQLAELRRQRNML